jgi:hypothetical protein
MTINVRMLITILFLMGLTPLYAQNQRLTWVGDENTMRYEVIIEKEEAEEYNNVLREFTEETFIEVSLSSGKYRCQVIPYDFLNQPIPVTEWMDFEVLSGNAHPGDGTSRAEIVLTVTAPKAVSTAAEPEKIIEYKNQFDLYLSVAEILLLPINDDSAAALSYWTAVRFGIVSAKRRFYNPGMELTASWRTHTMLFDYNIIQQFRTTYDRSAHNLRLGTGVSLVSNDDPRWATGQYSVHLNIGASTLYLILKNMFLETGMEYSQLFTTDFPYFFRAWVGLGYRF